MLKRQNGRSSKYKVHSTRANITVSSVHNDGRNILGNVFDAHGNALYVSIKHEHFFFYMIIKTTLLRKYFEYTRAIAMD